MRTSSRVQARQARSARHAAALARPSGSRCRALLVSAWLGAWASPAPQPAPQPSLKLSPAAHQTSLFEQQLLEQEKDQAAAEGKPQLTLSWAGSGLYFFWQLGAMKHLAERYDLTSVPMVGASGGGLVSVLAACGVPADRILEHAYALSLEYNIWERPMGLLGVWGALVERWLDDLLPDDAHERCRGRVTLVVTALPNMRQVGISDFTSKRDLIDVCMASAHVPIVLDMKLTRACRGMACVDGSFPDFFTSENSDLLKCGGSSVIFDYFEDPMLVRKGRMDMLELRTYDEVKRMMQLGYEYSAKLHSVGRFRRFELAEVMMDSAGHMQEVMVDEQHHQQVLELDGPSKEEVQHAQVEMTRALLSQQQQ